MQNESSGGATSALAETGAENQTGGPELTRIQKLAVLILMINEQNATQIMKGLDEHELGAVTAEMAKLPIISYEVQESILREFAEVAVDASTAVVGGIPRAKGLLEKSVGLFRADDIIGRISPQRPPSATMQQIVDMDGRHIYSMLRNEQAQTIALVSSYLSKEKAAEVLAMFRPELRDQAIERLATLSPTSIEVVDNVAEELQSKFGGNRRRVLNQTGGVKVAAQVLNSLPKNMTKAVLSALQERNAKLAQEVGEKMFTFDELARLDTRTLQVILQTVDLQMLAVALKPGSEKLKASLLGALSRRAAEAVREEMEFSKPLKLSEIEAAQSKIIEIVRELEGQGEIDLEAIRSDQRF